MNENFIILVADRNRHVREFLKREFVAEGYAVVTAGDGYEVLRILGGFPRPDLLILDLEIPYAGRKSVLEMLLDLNHQLPVVIHAFPSEYGIDSQIEKLVSSVVEKSGNTDRLKTVVMDVLHQYYPDRCCEHEELIKNGLDI